MSKSVLVMETPENCYVCPFGTAYCSALEYEGLCELADCLDCDVILMTEVLIFMELCISTKT